MERKRNSEDEIEDVSSPGDGQTDGGGGSAGDPAPCQGGAGYLATCTDLKAGVSDFGAPADGDEWLARLRACGISKAMLRVAERVGFDTFMEVWSALDDDELLDEKRRVYIPQQEHTLLRYQRQQIILEMGRRGMKAGEILRKLPERSRRLLSRRTVMRIISGK